MEDLEDWVNRNLALVNLVFIVISAVSYVATMYALSYWTYGRWPQGEKGGVLDYQWFGISTVYHVLPDNSLETVFWFPDIALYFLLTLVILNLLHYFAAAQSTTNRRPNVASAILAILGIVAYVATMRHVDFTLKSGSPPIGGILLYVPFLLITTRRVNLVLTRVEFFDYLLWLLLALFIVAIIIVRRETKNRQVNE